MPLFGINGVVDFKDLKIGRAYVVERQGKKHVLIREKSDLTECTVNADGVLENVVILKDPVKERKKGIGYREPNVLYDESLHNLAKHLLQKCRRGEERRILLLEESGIVDFHIDADGELDKAVRILDPPEGIDEDKRTCVVLYNRRQHERAKQIYDKLRVRQAKI